MEQNFERAFEFAMKWEAWRSDNPSDPGGLTIWGISSKYYPETVTKIKDMPKEESRHFARGFYASTFWEAMGCDRIANPLDIIVFDTAINPGPGAAEKFLALTHNWRDYLFLRLAYYASARSANVFLRGWTNRVVDLWQLARGF